MPAYCFFNTVKITDSEGMDDYHHRVYEIVEKFGGEFIIIGGPFKILEGSPKIHYPVMIKFESIERAFAWYESTEYSDLLKLRMASGEYDVFLMEGI